MTCPVCRRANLVEISLTLSQRPVVMRSCSACGHRRWQAEGRPTHLSGVLELAAAARS